MRNAQTSKILRQDSAAGVATGYGRVFQPFLTHGTPNKALKLPRRAINFRGEIVSLKTSYRIVFESSTAKILIVTFKNNVDHGFRQFFIQFFLSSTFPQTTAAHRFKIAGLQARRPRGCRSIPDRGTIFLLSTSSRPVLGPIQTPIQYGTSDSFPGGKAARA
jgi:hypothetical protein